MARVLAWEDDPLTEPAVNPISRTAPDSPQAAFPVRVSGRRPAPAKYPARSPEFRYWNGLDALTRASTYWAAAAAPSRAWQCDGVLPVYLDGGPDLNAYYDRSSLSFFHASVSGVMVFSGESPDVLCHEHGHAVLDAVRPALWNAASTEVDAFHESFGDVAAMLCSLQLPSFRTAVLTQTGGRLARASRLSRIAEQLGWAVRQIRQDAVDPDCLRNASNSFVYRDPLRLPSTAPASSLSSEPHSFSRVFTAAWLESLAAMTERAGTDSRGLAGVARDAGRLLVKAVREARVASNYFAQVAAHLLRAESELFAGRDQEALRAAFVRRGILSVDSAARIVEQLGPTGPPRGADGERHTMPVRVDGAAVGLGVRAVVADGPMESARSAARSAAPGSGSLEAAPAGTAVEAFVADLVRRRRLDVGPFGRGRHTPGGPRTDRLTHRLVRDGRDARLERCRFH